MLCLGAMVVFVGFEVYEVAALYHSCERSAI
jgi:hypothetical protein